MRENSLLRITLSEMDGVKRSPGSFPAPPTLMVVSPINVTHHKNNNNKVECHCGWKAYRNKKPVVCAFCEASSRVANGGIGLFDIPQHCRFCAIGRKPRS